MIARLLSSSFGFRRCLSALPVLFLSGCLTLGPDYERPETSLAADFKHAPEGAGPRPDAFPKGDWWTVFGDAKLNDLMTAASAGNQTSRAALARLEQARAAIGLAQAPQWPRLVGDGFAQRRQMSTNSQFGDFQPTLFNDYDLGLTLSYEIDLWGRIRRQVEAAEANSYAALADYGNTMLTVHAELARNYFTLRALDQEIALIESTIGLRQEAVDIAQARLDAGEAGDLDVARAETELATTRASIESLRTRRGELENAIAILSGQSPSTFRIHTSPLTKPAPRIPAGIPGELLVRRPDVAAAEARLAAANANIGVARAAFYPRITLTGDGGLSSISTSTFFESASRRWAIGPEITVPIFQGAQNRENLRQTVAEYDEALADYLQQLLESLGDVENALNLIAGLDRESAAQNQASNAAGRAADLSRTRYDNGLVSYLEVVDAERTALEVDRRKVQISGERYVATIALVQALGGGWDARDAARLLEQADERLLAAKARVAAAE